MYGYLVTLHCLCTVGLCLWKSESKIGAKLEFNCITLTPGQNVVKRHLPLRRVAWMVGRKKILVAVVKNWLGNQVITGVTHWGARMRLLPWSFGSYCQPNIWDFLSTLFLCFLVFFFTAEWKMVLYVSDERVVNYLVKNMWVNQCGHSNQELGKFHISVLVDVVIKIGTYVAQYRVPTIRKSAACMVIALL
jgi:hypothetical protein